MDGDSFTIYSDWLSGDSNGSIFILVWYNAVKEEDEERRHQGILVYIGSCADLPYIRSFFIGRVLFDFGIGLLSS
uniref:Uncharacterized protein n=1 Tax=Utricularia reniformis TaxID=192314 RepID=A0A1Y0B4B6_9LAMI|nr:hypothetical protein AEK19_MT2085 [Utricularia reniformis]ART32240.1 hypothetical protein AEK19_MT2085 [Utricularia reniformis]